MPFQLISKLISIFDKKHKLYITLIFLLFFLQMLLELFSVTLFIPLISIILDSEISNNSFYLFFKNNFDLDLFFILGDIKNFIILFVLTFVIKSVLTTYCNWNKIGFTYKIRKYLTSKIYQKYLNSPYEDFISKNSSLYLKNINHEINTVSEGLFQLLEFFSEIVIIIGIGLFLINYNFEVTATIFILASLVIFLINFFTKKKITQLGDKVRTLEQFRIQNYVESFNLIKEIKIYGNEKFFEKRDRILTSNFLKNDFIFRFIKSVPRVLVELMLIIIFVILIVINLKVGDTKYILELLGIFAASAYRLMPSAVRIVMSLQVSKFALSATNNIVSEIISSPFYNSDNIEKKKINKFKEKIQFSNICFTYKGTIKPILDNINLDIHCGKIIGFKGSTGSGKTTIINLLAGLIDPTKGSLYIDKNNYKELNIKSLHNLISYVPQNTYLMDASIKDNIFFGSEKYTKTDLEDSINKTNLKKFIEQSPQGFETIIGEKSSKISGGQAQRIGIARALIKKPSILILDESTNSLDKSTEDQILESIKKLKGELTIILVSHNSNPLRICDYIIDIDKLQNK